MLYLSLPFVLGEVNPTAIYTINYLPPFVLDNVSPFESLYHTPPDYSSLKVFGCACFVLLQPYEYTKLELRACLLLPWLWDRA